MVGSGRIFAGREISVFVAAEMRKRPEEMRRKMRVREPSGLGGRRSSYYGGSRSQSRSPHYPAGSRSHHRSRSYSPAPHGRNGYSVSPRRRNSGRSRSPRVLPQERDMKHTRQSYSPSYVKVANQKADGYHEKTEHDGGEEINRRSSLGRLSRSPSGSRSRSADISR